MEIGTERALSLIVTAVLSVAALGAIGSFADNGLDGVAAYEKDMAKGKRFTLVSPEVELDDIFLSGAHWTVPEFDGALYPPTDGGPSVPVLVRKLELPGDVKDMSILRSDPVTYVLDHPIPPSFQPRVVGEEGWNDPANSKLELDSAAYGSPGPFPERPLTFTHLGYGWENGTRHSSYSVQYSPMDYDPSRSAVTLYRDIQLLIGEEDEGEAMAKMMAPSRVDPPLTLIEGTELLVIAHDPFLDDLRDYIEWKREKGLIVTVVGYSSVNSAYPAFDGPTSIWHYIRDSFMGGGQSLKWVLLAGEPRFVPSRMVYDLDPYIGEPQYLAADTYYSCLDGSYTNWNSDGDNRWGEMGDITDYEPDVYVSRISLDTETEAFDWGRKVVSYEKNPSQGTWYDTAAFFGSTTHFEDDGPTESEDLWDLYLDRVHITLDRYYSPGNVQQATGAKYLTYGNIDQGLSGGFSTLCYMGHGHYALWSEGTQEQNSIIYTTNEAGSLSNGNKLPLIFAMSCETNWFDDDSFESISEAFTENPNGGALAYLGAVRTTEGGIGFTPHQYTPGAPGIQEDVLRMIASGRRRTAEILLEAKEYYNVQWSSYYYAYPFAYNAWMEHSILGPPDTEIWTSQPKVLNAVHSHNEDRYSNFTVTVTDDRGGPVNNALVCIRSSTLDRSAVAMTGTSGTAVIPFEITGTAYAKVTASVPGSKPFQSQVLLTDRTPPEVDLMKERPYPDGTSGWYRSDPVLTLSPSEPSTVFFRWNGGEPSTYTGTISIPKGENTIEYWATDDFDNEGAKKSAVIKYDPDAPDIKVVMDPEAPDGKGGWFISAPTIELELQGNAASQETVEYWWDRNVKQVYSVPFTALEGEHELHILASDEAGNKAPQIDIELMVDTEVPQTMMETGGIGTNENGWYTEPMKVSLRTEDRSAKVLYRWDDAPSWSQYSTPLDPLTGNHSLHYRAEDNHGNIEPEWTVQVPYDLSPPVLRYTVSPQQPTGSNGWYTKPPTISLSGEDDTGEFVIMFRTGKGEYGTYEHTITLQEGTTLFEAYILDMAGNRGEGISITFKVDSSSDRTESETDASQNVQGWYVDLPMVTLRTGGKTQIYYRFVGFGDFTKYGGAFLPPAEEGSFQLEYYSVDEAGNIEPIRTRFMSIDAKAPIATVDGPSSAKVGETIAFDLSGSTDGIGIKEYYFDPGDGTDGSWDDGPVFEHKYKKAGTFKAVFMAKDASGHESEPVEMEVTIEGDGTTVLLIGAAAFVVVIILAALGAIVVVHGSRQHRQHAQHHPRPPPRTGGPGQGTGPTVAYPHHSHTAMAGRSAAQGAGKQLHPPPNHPRPVGIRAPSIGGRAPQPHSHVGGDTPFKGGKDPGSSLPGPLPSMAIKGVHYGDKALTATQGKLNVLIDKEVDRGRPFSGDLPKNANEVPPPQSSRKPSDIPEPPKPPKF